jgi:hypothetical protein
MKEKDFINLYRDGEFKESSYIEIDFEKSILSIKIVCECGNSKEYYGKSFELFWCDKCNRKYVLDSKAKLIKLNENSVKKIIECNNKYEIVKI